MANVLRTAYRNRNIEREFVDMAYLSRFTRISSERLMNMRVFEGLPYRYDPQGHIEYRNSDAMRALRDWRLMPPDNLHPLYEFSQAEAMLELHMVPDTIRSAIKTGKVRSHISEYDGHVKIYRKDIDLYLRNWDPRSLAVRMVEPLRRKMCALIMGIKVSTFRKKERSGAITPMPREPHCFVKFSKAEVLRAIDARGNRYTRKEPLPDMMEKELAIVYAGFSRTKFEKMKDMNAIVPVLHTLPNGCKKWMYRKEDLDRLRDEELAREYYCETYPYYTRKAIKYKFFKTDRWVDTFICGKCRTMRSKTEIIPLGQTSNHVAGWVKEDVEKVIASGANFKYRKKTKPRKPTLRKSLSMEARATPPVTFSSPVEQMEAAIRMAMEEKDIAKKNARDEVKKKMREEYSRRQAIRNILSTGGETKPLKITRNDLLRYSSEPQIVTFLLGAKEGGGKRYTAYPHTKDERIFRVSCWVQFGRRKIPPSFARAVANALTIFNSYKFEKRPGWVIVVGNTSLISDPMFHDKLAAVPPEYGAVGAYGYGYLLPDGSWDGCAETYGSYGVYSEISGEYRKVEGLKSQYGSNPVEFLGGPFIALRGDYMQELANMKYFTMLGDARGLMVPCISGICRKYGIKMMQIPVECWASIEFEVRPGTPEMNLGVERIKKFVDLSDNQIKDMYKKG